VGELTRKVAKRDKPAKTYPQFGGSLERLIRRGRGPAENVVSWIINKHVSDKSRAYAWLRGELSGTRTLTANTLAILLCYLFQQGRIHGLDEVWDLLNRGPERYWASMARLFQLQPWGVPPCSERLSRDCCLQASIKTIGWYLGQTIPTFPVDVPPYSVGRPGAVSLLHEGIQRGRAEKKPVLVFAPRTGGMTTFFRQAVACVRTAIWERKTERRAPLARCQEWRGGEWPFAQAIYWRDRPDWDNVTWMQCLLNPDEPDGIGLGDISPEMLSALPVLLFLDDLRPGRPVQALQERLGPGAVVVAGRHGAFVMEDGILIELPAFQENEAIALMRRYWKVEGPGTAQPLLPEVQRQIMALSYGNPGFILEMLRVTRQITPDRMMDYLQSAQHAPSQVQGEAPMAEQKAAVFIRRLLQALTPTQREALQKVVALPYFIGYGVWELARLWEMDESSAHALLGEIVQQGFGVSRPGGLAGHWHLSPVMYRWLRRAFGATNGEAVLSLSTWRERVLNAAGFEQYQRALAKDLERLRATGEQVYTAYVDETRMPLQRMSMLKRLIFYLRHREAYALEAWRSIPADMLTTGEYFLGAHLLPEAEQAAHRLHFWTLLGIIGVLFLYFTQGLQLEHPIFDAVATTLLLWMALLWSIRMLWLLYRPRSTHRWLARLLRRVLRRWQQGEFDDVS